MMTGIANVCLPRASIFGMATNWDGRSVMSHLAAIAVAGLLLWLAVNRLEWLRLKGRQYSQTQEALFAELCQAHDLSRTDRALLSLISQSIDASRPCCVFLDPRIIQQFAQNNPADAENSLDLFRRLFGMRSR